jgi:hypothetical protein
MINWQNLIKNVDQKDIEDYSELREGNSKPGMLNGILFSKKSGKGYNIVVQTNTDQLLPTSLVRVYCNCDDFKFRWAYVLHKHDALLAPTSFILTPPKITNKTQDIGCCKHIKIFLQKKSKNQVNRIDMTKGNL